MEEQSKAEPKAPKGTAAPVLRTVAEWAVLKGHCHVAFNAKRKAEKRPPFRGDRHKGIDVRVVRQHMIGKGELRPDWERTGDAVVSEAQYDQAADEAYSVQIGDFR